MASTVQIGDRIAQLVLEKIETPPVLEVDVGGSPPRPFFHSADSTSVLG
jgi:hypothetical protein